MARNKSFQVRLSDTLLQSLEEEAKHRGLKPTEMVRVAVSQVCVHGRRDRKAEVREVVNAG
jgi:hypothetical protein